MGLLTLLGSFGSVPAVVSASVLSDGVTLRLVFDQPLTSGSATSGFTRSVGTISSGTYSGVNLDLVIPKVYQGDSVGTITYVPGTLAGSGGSVVGFGPLAITNNAAAWNPGDLASVVDYGVWSDTSRLKQNSDGSGAVASPGDPVGWWRGQKDVLTFIIGTAANKPAFASDGIDFTRSGSIKTMSASITSRDRTLPVSVGNAHYAASASTDNIVFGPAQATANDPTTGTRSLSSTNDRYAVRATLTSHASAPNGNRRMHVTYTGIGGTNVGTGYRNGSTQNLTVGSTTGNDAVLTLATSGTSGGGKSHAWYYATAALSASDIAKIDTWFQTVDPT